MQIRNTIWWSYWRMAVHSISALHRDTLSCWSVSLIPIHSIPGWLYSSGCGTPAGTQPGGGHPLGEWHQREGEATSSAHCGSERWHQVCCPPASEWSQRWCTIQGKSLSICREVRSDCQHLLGDDQRTVTTDSAALWSGNHRSHFHVYLNGRGLSVRRQEQKNSG